MGAVTWNLVSIARPEKHTDVLCYFAAVEEYHVLALDDVGEWYRAMDDELWAEPDYWSELPASPV